MSFFGDKFKAELKNLVLEILEELDLYSPPKTTATTETGASATVSGGGVTVSPDGPGGSTTGGKKTGGTHQK